MVIDYSDITTRAHERAKKINDALTEQKWSMAQVFILDQITDLWHLSDWVADKVKADIEKGKAKRVITGEEA